MTKLLITGPTGSGKTYKAIEIAKQLGRYAYFAPTSMLVQDTAHAYGSPWDSVACKGIEVNLNYNKNFFGCFGSLPVNELSNYDCVVIDEAHWINGDFPNQAKFIRDVINNASTSIILLTGTQTFETPQGFKELVLQSNRQIPKYVDIDDENDLVLTKKTLIICSRIMDVKAWAETYKRIFYDKKIESKIYIAHRDLSESENIEQIRAFNNAGHAVLVASNIAQQGVNLKGITHLIMDLYCPAEYYREYCKYRNIFTGERYIGYFHTKITTEELVQKLGRIGRFNSPDVQPTYSIACENVYGDPHYELFDSSIDIKDTSTWEVNKKPLHDLCDNNSEDKYKPPTYSQIEQLVFRKQILFERHIKLPLIKEKENTNNNKENEQPKRKTRIRKASKDYILGG